MPTLGYVPRYLQPVLHDPPERKNNTKVAFPPIRVAEKCSARDAKMTAYCFECFHRGPRLRVQVGENSEMSDTS